MGFLHGRSSSMHGGPIVGFQVENKYGALVTMRAIFGLMGGRVVRFDNPDSTRMSNFDIRSRAFYKALNTTGENSSASPKNLGHLQ